MPGGLLVIGRWGAASDSHLSEALVRQEDRVARLVHHIGREGGRGALTTYRQRSLPRCSAQDTSPGHARRRRPPSPRRRACISCRCRSRSAPRATPPRPDRSDPSPVSWPARRAPRSPCQRVQKSFHLLGRVEDQPRGRAAAPDLRIVGVADEDTDALAGERLEGVLVGDVVAQVERNDVVAVQPQRLQTSR
jgi:hypothetical protein